MRRVSILLLSIITTNALVAQTFTPESDLRYKLFYDRGDQAAADTVQPVRQSRLMPEHVSFMERSLWGEHGILREAGIASPLTAESRRSELGIRRSMLTAHQLSGFVTFGLMAASCYYGQRVIDGHHFESEKHSTIVKYAVGSYALTAALSVFSPPPLIRREENSTTTLHKTLAWIHFSGMVLTPIIGYSVWRIHGSPTGPVLQQNNSLARFHQVSAYVTTATLGAALVVMTF